MEPTPLCANQKLLKMKIGVFEKEDEQKPRGVASDLAFSFYFLIKLINFGGFPPTPLREGSFM